MSTGAKERIVFPLDVGSLDEARLWIGALSGEVGVFKVGLEVFTAVGPEAVTVVRRAGAKCFLDLKLHDIPETMARATRAAVALGVDYLTVHAASGHAALTGVREAARGSSLRLLAVTVLTSLDDAAVRSLGLGESAQTAVLKLAGLARGAGIDGFVCSPKECADLRASAGAGALLVVPGVRPTDAARGDQARTATPRQAIVDGADLLVVGRPIRDASDPKAAARAIAQEIELGLADSKARRGT